MENVAIAKLSYSRISPRKIKIVIDLIRNKPVGTALAILRNTPKAASPLIEKLLLSAMANAENNHGMDVENLYVAEIYSSAGPILKRIRPRAQGRAFRIFKRTSHTTIVLKEKEIVVPKEEEKKTSAKKKKAADTKPVEKADTKAEVATEAATEVKKPRKPRASKKKTEEAKAE